MKLSEAMQKGWKKIGKKQNFEEYFSFDKTSACALGCVVLGYYGNKEGDDHRLKDDFPVLVSDSITCLAAKTGYSSLFTQIVTNNDRLKKSVPDIIKGLKKCGL